VRSDRSRASRGADETSDIRPEEMLSEPTRLTATAGLKETLTLTGQEAEALRARSLDEVRTTLDSGRFAQLFQDLKAFADRMVAEVLTRTVLTGLGSIRTHDTYTYHHCLDVAVIAVMLGHKLGVGLDTLRKLALGCILHDSGKIFVALDLS
jgi:HD-GYP domain-containing protein (c-di-GMP phosphodiesterase class II)